MKTDTLTGTNLSMQVALLEKKPNPQVRRNFYTVELTCYIDSFDIEDGMRGYDYADPATFQPIAEREKISCAYLANGKWQACTINKKATDGSRYSKNIYALGGTEAEARMRCYVKSYLGDDTKGE